jgi:acyl-CoA thioester hydrolase
MPIDQEPAAPFSITLFARWPDMDFNQHMRNAAYLGVSEDCRMSFLASHGFTMEEFRKRQIGPIVVEDKLTYKRELHLLEEFRVELLVAGITPDARKMKLRNIIRRKEGTEACIVESLVLWFDIKARKPIVPPEDLQRLWLAAPRPLDFALFPET